VVSPMTDPKNTQRPREQIRQRPFPGAACCHPTELPSYKAAPLQAIQTCDPAKQLSPTRKPPPLQTIFLYAAPVSLDVFRREIRGCGDAKAKCA
jgi:hypothetical protein